MSWWDDTKNWFNGGDATKSFNKAAAPTYAGFIGTAAKSEIEGGGANQQVNFGQSDQSRGQMMGLAGMMQGVASGQQKGAGELAAERQMHGAEAALQAQARISRGANAAIIAKNAARATIDGRMAGAGMAQRSALDDQTAARSTLAGLLGNVRGADLQAQQLDMSNRGQNAQMFNSYLAQLMGLDEQKRQLALAQQAAAAGDKGHLGALLQAGGAIGGAMAAGPGGAAAGAQAGKALG